MAERKSDVSYRKGQTPRKTSWNKQREKEEYSREIKQSQRGLQENRCMCYFSKNNNNKKDEDLIYQERSTVNIPPTCINHPYNA